LTVLKAALCQKLWSRYLHNQGTPGRSALVVVKDRRTPRTRAPHDDHRSSAVARPRFARAAAFEVNLATVSTETRNNPPGCPRQHRHFEGDVEEL